MKYVVVKIKMSGVSCEMPFIFPQNLAHSDFYDGLGFVIAAHKWDHRSMELMSAGFYNPATGRCSGRSDSLNIDSRPGDAVLIMTSDYGGGFK